MIRRLSTADVEPYARLDYWRNACRELIGNVEVYDCDANSARGLIEVSEVADLRIGHFIATPQTIHLTQSSIRPGDSDDYIVLLESQKILNNEHNGRSRSGCNGIVLFDITQPYYCSHPDGLDVIDVGVPRKAFEQALGPARHAAGLTIEPDQASYPLLSAFLRSLQQHGPALDASSAERLSSVALDLIAVGFAEKMGQDPSRRMSAAVALYRAQAYIANNITNPGLGMQEVAAALRVSVRRLHQIAADEGFSLVDWMWERRLQRARGMLSELANQSASVEFIAYQCGFADQAHFSRRFKTRFGQSPKDFRQRQQARQTQAEGCVGSRIRQRAP